jgi:hypothetical protein
MIAKIVIRTAQVRLARTLEARSRPAIRLFRSVVKAIVGSTARPAGRIISPAIYASARRGSTGITATTTAASSSALALRESSRRQQQHEQADGNRTNALLY